MNRTTAGRPRRNVLCIADDAPIMGGAERFALRLGQEAIRARAYDQVVVICPASAELAQAAQEAGLAVEHARFPDPRVGSLWQVPSALARLRSLVKLVRATSLVGNTARAQFWVALSLVGWGSAPELIHLVHEQDSAARRPLRLLYARTGRLEVVGGNGVRLYRERLSSTEIHQVNNFLTEDDFTRLSTIPPPEVPEPSRLVMGVLGRMIPEKGFIELVEELAVLGEDTWGSLKIAAFPQDSSYQSRLATKVDDLGLNNRIEMTGPARDVAGFLASIHVLLVPSTGREGQPTVILEALAARRPVIVRSGIYSNDYDQLPVTPYADPAELKVALAAIGSLRFPASLLRDRFGAEQALAAVASSPSL